MNRCVDALLVLFHRKKERALFNSLLGLAQLQVLLEFVFWPRRTLILDSYGWLRRTKLNFCFFFEVTLVDFVNGLEGKFP